MAATILIVEDEYAVARGIQYALQQEGYQVAVSRSGEEGLEFALREGPDLVVLDVRLPGIDGFEVLRRLRAQPQTALTRCIALSANAMPEDIALGLAAGFDDYWTKPIKFKPFLEALQQQFPLAATT